MKAGTVLSLGSIAAISVLGAGYLTFGVVGTDALTDYTTASMTLTSSGSLGVGSPVLLTGVEVGEVTSVDIADPGVRVGFRFDDKWRIPVDSAVSIENLSALGEPYVEFEPRTDTGPYVRDGQAIETDRIRMPLSIPAVSRLLTQVMNQLDPATLGRLVDTFGTAMQHNDTAIPEIARATALLAASTTERMPEIERLLNNMQQIAPDTDWVGSAATTAAPPFVAFAGRVDEISHALDRLFTTGDSPRMYLEGNGLVPFLTKLTQWMDTAGPELAPLVPVLRPLVEQATAAVPRIDIGRMISAALNGVGDDGAVHLRVRVK
ncbi:Mce family protein MceF [Nocardia nova SH22a]|uniref:Mce family protein MceF n=1 Tax=Nocardia nova SH22a TaxID=1415166 RepID=W5TKU5_9NOCA|nr:MlaD family protein [Nocardia nova]AHH19970.1 Mce family protein MceF [Nocardia nova SH22a]